MIQAQIYGGPIDGFELEIPEDPGIIYFLDAAPRVAGLTPNPDAAIERLHLTDYKVYILVPQQRGDIVILNWFEKVERNDEACAT